jgi:hypothetical protein
MTAHHAIEGVGLRLCHELACGNVADILKEMQNTQLFRDALSVAA